MYQTKPNTNVLLQGFNWNSWRKYNKQYYRYLQTKSKEIKDFGIDGVWFPPPSKSVSPQGYMPLDLYNLNSQYGYDEDLVRCINTFHNDDIDVYADLVLNHRCAEFQNEKGIYNVYGGYLAWDSSAIVGNDYNFCGKGNIKTHKFFDAAPNIDHSQKYIQEDLIEWMLWLKNEIGFDGFRFDFVLGYDPKYIREYVTNTNIPTAIGEYWDCMQYDYNGNSIYNQNKHRQDIVNWIDNTSATSCAFDITTKGILHDALTKNEYWRLQDSEGKPSGVLGWWGEKCVTFLDNHDTHYESQNHWSFPMDKLVEGYAYILTHPGTPMIYWDHFQFKDIKHLLYELISIRKKYNITNTSSVKIIEADTVRYHACIDDRIHIVIGDKIQQKNNIFETKNVILFEQS